MEYIYEVGMFQSDKQLKDYSRKEKDEAYNRYINALSASIRGTGSIFLKRKPKDIYTNNFNRVLIGVHQANHDLQIVVDQYACAQYVVGYLTKNESGMSKLLKAVNDQAKGLTNSELIKEISSVLDKGCVMCGVTKADSPK